MFNSGSDGKQLLVRGRTQLMDDQPRSAAEEKFEGFYPGVSPQSAPAGGSPRSRFIIVHDDGSGTPKMHRCDDGETARRFLEMLLARGVSREAVELFQASPVAFSVRFRPVVAFATR